jgi:hypothetical protein
MKINPKVVSDRFDDEVVVVSLESGIYYSFKNSAIEIWSQLEKRASQQIISKSFGTLTTEQQKELNAFFEFLVQENLVSLSFDEASHDTEPATTSFTSPLYAKFDDMANLIMIDPIHEADQAKGWPNKAE